MTSASPATFVVFLASSWLASKWVVIEILEFHLFPWFDDETLRPIGEKTGLLYWTDLADSPAHDAANKLRAWLNDGVHDGAWPITWILRGSPFLANKALSYTLLLGPNGIGKSQLVREIAREKLGVPGFKVVAGSKRVGLRAVQSQFAGWIRRVLPWLPRLPGDPWHIGEIVPYGDWGERLSAWRPSAPTALIIDDPYGAMARDALDILDKNSGQFWYTVKLLVVDQFTPAKIKLEASGRHFRDHLGREIPTFLLSDLRWSGEQARRVLAGGVWVQSLGPQKSQLVLAREIPEFWKSSNIERLSLALDGNPLMLSEAAAWLAARNDVGRLYRTIEELLSRAELDPVEQEVFEEPISATYRSEIAHRILSERVDELFASHLSWAREMSLDETAIVDALCCASLVGGAPLSEFAIFDKAQRSRVDKWVARDSSGLAILPPVGSWPLSAFFIERALRDYRILSYDSLARTALTINPVGFARQLLKRGRLARCLFNAYARLHADAAPGSPLALNFFAFAAARAVWADRSAVPVAITSIQKLSPSVLTDAQEKLEISSTESVDVPDVLIAVLLLTELALHCLIKAGTWDWNAWNAFLPLWTSWLNRLGSDVILAPPEFRVPLIAGGAALGNAFFTAAASNKEFSTFEFLKNNFPIRTFSIIENMLILSESNINTWPVVFKKLSFLRSLSSNEFSSARESEDARRRFEIVASNLLTSLPEESSEQQRMFVEVQTLSGKALLESNAGASVAVIDGIEAHFDHVVSHSGLDPDSARDKLVCIAAAVQNMRRKGASGDAIWARAEEAEQILNRFSDDAQCVGYVLMCWHYAFETAASVDDTLLNLVMTRLRMYSSRYSDDVHVLTGLTALFVGRIVATVNKESFNKSDESVEYLANEIDLIASEKRDVASLQWPRTKAWAVLTAHWKDDAQLGIKISSKARMVDAVARSFPYHRGIQWNRIAIWCFLAEYEAKYGLSPSSPEGVARFVTRLARDFLDDERITGLVTSTWAAAVAGWARDTREWTSCERALGKLENWLADNPADLTGTQAQISAWVHLINVHLNRSDKDALGRLGTKFSDRIRGARARFPEEPFFKTVAGEFTRITALVPSLYKEIE